MAPLDLPTRHVQNANITPEATDVLYHLGLSYSEANRAEIASIFGNVKFFICGGSADRMKTFAHKLAEKLQITTPFGYNIAPIGSTSRYVIFKVGPVLIANVRLYLNFESLSYDIVAWHGHAFHVDPSP
ncbi:Aste57867_7246 [Aphanomyces stellatus]|uniref:Aste57867_7123 protein n=1 Tax=Aphanomyces stellatus TaxID=120398 RepID=A0A485KHK3_9STRA|nr:hypothetical protein As57867_007221 [Aphanomyces stellatus]KAF0705135.1 hypothetical protein As57867_007099 [Aphanomyces stellatus]VFT84055.1 Aste57867_7123 [Aphanomyces stellatus]VFT84170.1 Aste57867_7246 [Aphanomyces stellatus]